MTSHKADARSIAIGGGSGGGATPIAAPNKSHDTKQLSHARQPSFKAGGTLTPSAASAVSSGGASIPQTSPPSGSSVSVGSGIRHSASNSSLKSLTGSSGGSSSKAGWSPGTIATIDCKHTHFVLMVCGRL